jgi:hypothetical protein
LRSEHVKKRERVSALKNIKHWKQESWCFPGFFRPLGF